MADLQEPPPLFDDEDSRKDDETDDLFASAVQSPMSEVTTPEGHKQQKSVQHESEQPVLDPLSAPPVSTATTAPAPLTTTVDNTPTQSVTLAPTTDLFDSPEEEQAVPTGFSSVNLEEPVSSLSEEVCLDDDADENALFQSAVTPQLLLNQDIRDASSSILPPMGVPITPPGPTINTTTTNHPTSSPNMNPNSPIVTTNAMNAVSRSILSADQIERDSGDEFIWLNVSDPQKIGDGMGAYMAYKVTTKTNLPFFRKKNWSVTRRFSDFLGLHSKLVEKHLQSGRIIPPAPEKAAIASTKIKLGSDKSCDSSSSEFIEKRRAALERYMVRTSAHPTLRADPDFREFIELDAELPKATQTSAMSSAGMLRLFNRVGETVNKMTYKMEESDQWFEEKTLQVESIDAQLRKLHAAMEGLVGYRRELAMSTAAFAKSTAYLSSIEEHSALSRALHQLAEATERIQTIHHAQADADFFHLSENAKDYIGLIGAVKDVFHERVKTFQTWQHSQTLLAKKREAKAKAELAGRLDKVQTAQEDVQEWESKVERSQEEFDRISRAIKKEMEHFDIVRVADFKDSLVKYLEALVTSQQQVIKVWETFLPEAKAIV